MLSSCLFGINMLVENPRQKKWQRKNPQYLEFGTQSEIIKPKSAVEKPAEISVKPLLKHEEQSPPTSTYRFVKAKPGQRILATLINIILFFVFFVLAVVYDLLTEDVYGAMSFIPVYLFTQLLLMWSRGQTLGKRIMKIYVVETTTEKKLPICRYLFREVVGAIIYIVFWFNIFIDTFKLLGSGDLETFSRSGSKVVQKQI